MCKIRNTSIKSDKIQRRLNYLAFQYFDIQRTWWRLFQKRVLRTKFDIYVFISNLGLSGPKETKLDNDCHCLTVFQLISW